MSVLEEDINKTAGAMVDSAKNITAVEPYKAFKRSLNISDSFDSFIIHPKKRRNTESVTSSTDSRYTKAELIGAKVHIVTLENKLKQLQYEYKELQILHNTKVRKLEDHTWWDKIQIRELNRALTKVRERETKVQEELVNLKTKYNILRLSTDINIERFENQLIILKTDLSLERSQKREELGNHKQKIEELQQVIEVFKDIEVSQKSYAEELEKRLAEKNEISQQLEIKTCELNNARLELNSLQYLKENYELYQQQIKTHEKKLYGYDILEEENKRLKEDNKQLKELVKGKLLLEEQVYDLNNRLKRFKEQQVELEELRTKQVQYDFCLNEWRAIANGFCEPNVSDSRLPHILRCAIEALQKQEMNLTAEKVSLHSTLSAAVHESRLTATDLDKTRKQLNELKNNFEESQNLIQHMQNKLNIVCAERDSYKAQLESYECDLSMNAGARTRMDPQKADKDLIKKLNLLIEEYRTTLTKLENDLRNLSHKESSFLSSKIILLQAEINNLKTENDYLRERRDTLEVHLENIARMGGKPDNIQNEDCQTLLKQIEESKQHLNAKNADIDNIKMQHEKEIRNLKQEKQIADNEANRLKEHCKKSLDEFQNIVYILFGYKIDSETDNQYVLTSMFTGDHEDEQLCFQLCSEGVMNLLENKYSLSLGNFIDVHLRKHKSIPMFLSAITTDLFNKQKSAAMEAVEVEDESSVDAPEISDENSSKVSVYDTSDKSSEYSGKHSDSPRSKMSDSCGDSSDNE